MILGKWPTWLTVVFCVFISIFYMFRPTSCSSSGESILSIQNLVHVILCRWPFRVHVGKKLSDLHTKWSSTQSDIYQMSYRYNWFSWWWARGCSKHVENWNKYIEKNCASSWLFTKNHKKMHGQQNIKFCIGKSLDAEVHKPNLHKNILKWTRISEVNLNFYTQFIVLCRYGM